jgi:chemotaxis protein methyltransferase CheR
MIDTLSPEAFRRVSDLFMHVSGIRLTEAKRPLVAGRLQRLAQAYGSNSLEDYVERLLDQEDPAELTRVIDKLTTNATYFFREPQHFDALTRLVQERAPGPEFRVWSAASSSGEEAYSIAMVLAEHMPQGRWQVVGTDLSTSVVDSARRALYPMERARNMPAPLLKRWCLKGEGPYAGQLLISKELRQRVHFECANLTQSLPPIGQFDVIFLRNVLIYFDNPGKVDIVERVLGALKPGGFLYTGHAESLASLPLPLRAVAPAIYVPQ